MSTALVISSVVAGCAAVGLLVKSFWDWAWQVGHNAGAQSVIDLFGYGDDTH